MKVEQAIARITAALAKVQCAKLTAQGQYELDDLGNRQIVPGYRGYRGPKDEQIIVPATASDIVLLCRSVPEENRFRPVRDLLKGSSSVRPSDKTVYVQADDLWTLLDAVAGIVG